MSCLVNLANTCASYCTQAHNMIFIKISPRILSKWPRREGLFFFSFCFPGEWSCFVTRWSWATKACERSTWEMQFIPLWLGFWLDLTYLSPVFWHLRLCSLELISQKTMFFSHNKSAIQMSRSQNKSYRSEPKHISSSHVSLREWPWFETVSITVTVRNCPERTRKCA